MLWSNEKILTLINEYKIRELLWNPVHTRYRDKSSRREALDEISTKLNVPTEEIERKLHSLRTQFQRENRKRNDLSTWFAYTALRFLLDVVRTPQKYILKVEQNNDQTLVDDSTCEKDETFDEEFITSDNRPSTIAKSNSSESKSGHTVPQISESKYQQSPSGTKRRKLKSLSDCSPSREDEEVILNIPPQPTVTREIEKNDHLEMFGKYVTEELRNVDDQFSVQVAKHRINQILFDATTGLFKRPQ